MESKTKRYRDMLKELQHETKSKAWQTSWKELSEYILPRSGRYLDADTDTKNNDGSKKTQKILNSVATKSVKNLAAGMQGGLTSPARPWFVLALPNEELMEYKPVREWLHQVRQLMLNVFSRSNFYGAVHNLYKEIGTFGVGALLLDKDDDTVIRIRPFTIGEFYIDLDDKYRADTFVRQYSMTARQMVKAFSEDNVSVEVKTAYEGAKPLTRFEVVHCIAPNEEYDERKGDSRGMLYKSIYFELNCADKNKTLRDGGYRTKPFAVPRWEVSGTDSYGGSPGFDMLSDIKMLQVLETDELKAIHKHVDPPMNAPSAMKNIGGTIVGGDVNYLDVQQGQQGFTPAYQTNSNTVTVSAKIMQVEQRIREGFFNNLFLSILDQDKRMTATEVAERHEEKMLMLGPVLERLQAEFLDPIIERTFNIMLEMGLLPEAPEELNDQDIKVEYISLLAQAQKMVGTRSVEQLSVFVGNLAGMNPEVLDKFDMDEAVDQYSDMIGTPPKLVRTDDEVEKIREARREQQMQAERAMQEEQAANTAKTLSDTPVGNDSALDVVSGLGAGAI